MVIFAYSKTTFFTWNRALFAMRSNKPQLMLCHRMFISLLDTQVLGILIILVKFWETMHKDANDEKNHLGKINLELC